MALYWQKENKVLVQKPVPVQLIPPQILHHLLQSDAPVAQWTLRHSKENVQILLSSIEPGCDFVYNFNKLFVLTGAWGSVVVKALRY